MTLRCAIYTRKSSEEGLGQDFNSLHAQREACEAYITSQKHEGWQPIKTHYDDGGFSGGNIERPALKKLLEDIEAGRVNVVVVYKVDRLTRSLSDFAKIIERFDKHGVSFVSVTQQFNTTSSMGRLTLNVLLSFAQFEREVTGERIRDKIAASKQKGMWMGGPVPLGYKVDARKLVVVPEDAETLRHIFRSYLDLGCVRLLQKDLAQSGIRSKPAGNIMLRGSLYKLLSNPIYIGQIRHKGTCHPGMHQAIVGQDLWDRVQQQLSDNRIGRKTRSRKTESSSFAGKLFDESGGRLVPIHASKKGRRYRYYISQSITAGPAEGSANSWRLPAQEIESTVAQCAIRMLGDDRTITSTLRKAEVPVHAFPAALKKATEFRKKLASDTEKADVLAALVERVELNPDGLKVTLLLAPLVDPKSIKGLRAVLTQEISMRMKRRGVETKLIINGEDRVKKDPLLIKAIARGRVWFDELASARAHSIRDIAKRENVSESHVGNLLPLAFLAPDIVEAIMVGRQPPTLTLEALTKRIDLPLDWAAQRGIIK